MGERPPQYSISCLVSEETSIKSPSAKNSDNVMPKPLQMDSNVPMEGSEFRFRTIQNYGSYVIIVWEVRYE